MMGPTCAGFSACLDQTVVGTTHDPSHAPAKTHVGDGSRFVRWVGDVAHGSSRHANSPVENALGEPGADHHAQTRRSAKDEQRDPVAQQAHEQDRPPTVFAGRVGPEQAGEELGEEEDGGDDAGPEPDRRFPAPVRTLTDAQVDEEEEDERTGCVKRVSSESRRGELALTDARRQEFGDHGETKAD